MILATLVGVGLGFVAEFFSSFGNIQIKYSHVLVCARNFLNTKTIHSPPPQYQQRLTKIGTWQKCYQPTSFIQSWSFLAGYCIIHWQYNT